MKEYKKFRVCFLNNNNKVQVIYIDADNDSQAIEKIMNTFNIFKNRISAVSWFSTTYL